MFRIHWFVFASLSLCLGGFFTPIHGGETGVSSKAAFFEPSESIELTAEADGQLIQFEAAHPKLVDTGFSFQWDMGDGNTAKGRRPIHFYTTPGDYLVQVQITDQLGQSVVKQRTIKVEAAADFGYAWEPFGTTFDGRMNGMAAGEPGMVAAAKTGQLLFSANGFDWSPVDLFITEDIISVQWIDGAFWALAPGTERLDGIYLFYTVLLKSENGKQWERLQDIPSHVNALFHDGTRMFAMGITYPSYPTTLVGTTAEAGVIFRQNDEGQWIGSDIADRLFVNQMYRTDTGYLALASSAAVPYHGQFSLYTSSDGLAWEKREGEFGNEIVTNGKMYLRVHESIEVSGDALAWTKVDVDLPEPMRKVFWADNQFVALGNNFAMVSRTGLDWEVRSLSSDLAGRALNLVYHQGLWLASDRTGAAIYSEDGLTWKKHPVFGKTIQTRKWKRITTTDVGYAIGSENGYVRETTDGEVWTETRPFENFLLDDLTQGPRGLAISGARVNPPRGLLLERIGGEWETVFEGDTAISRAIYKYGIWHIIADKTLVQSGNRRDWIPQEFDATIVDITDVEGGLLVRAAKKLFLSENGLHWSEMNVPLGVITAATRKGELIVAAGFDGPAPEAKYFMALSYDGQTWEKKRFRTISGLEHLFVQDERIYVIGNSFADGSSPRIFFAPPMASSLDGQTWQNEKIFPSLRYKDTTQGENEFLILSQNGTILKQKPPSAFTESDETRPSKRFNNR